MNKYPWETLVFNRLRRRKTTPCDQSPVPSHLFRFNFPIPFNSDGGTYDICSGSLITNKHILTSAECLLKNKLDIFEDTTNIHIKRKEEKDKNDNFMRKSPEYSDAECIFVLIGIKNKDKALEEVPLPLFGIKHRYIHPHAFSHVNEFNYNIGKGMFFVFYELLQQLTIFFTNHLN